MLAFPTAGTCSDLGHLSVYCKTRYVLPMSTRLSGVAVCPKDKRDQGEGIDFNDPRRQAGADQAVQSVAHGPKGMVTINCGDFETTHIHNDRHGRKKTIIDPFGNLVEKERAIAWTIYHGVRWLYPLRSVYLL